ncbi:unnamed protein product [Spirodela intermedia]|uniref:Uncharacterized protein n=1 Tax=Spirodela intermedia TaxID=51605 RepID=A0A7I8KSW5_SPIIN|nr:unnamed protein product [Spirodela intermedia]
MRDAARKRESKTERRDLPVEEETITPTWASQSMANSSAFLNRPFRRFEKVTCLAVVLSIFLILIFPLDIPSFSHVDFFCLTTLLADRSNELTKKNRFCVWKPRSMEPLRCLYKNAWLFQIWEAYECPSGFRCCTTL